MALLKAPHNRLPLKNHYMSRMSKPSRISIDAILTTLNDKDGKDKSFKIIQYTGRLLSMTYFDGKPKPRQLESLISQFSQFRKIIRLGNWLAIARHLYLHKKIEILELVDLYTEISDDIYCLGRMGVLSKNLGHRADFHANIGWFLSVVLQLQAKLDLYVKSGKLDIASMVKLLCDMVFSGLDVFEFEGPKVTKTQTVVGLISGVLSYRKIYNQHYLQHYSKRIEEQKP